MFAAVGFRPQVFLLVSVWSVFFSLLSFSPRFSHVVMIVKKAYTAKKLVKHAGYKHI